MGTTFSISDRQAQGLRRTLIPILVALALLASQLPPFLVATSANAAVHPWTIDGQAADPAATVLTDPCGGSNDDIIVNGEKLNDLHVGTPKVTTGNANNKGDLCKVWLDLATVGTDVWLYFAWSRFEPNGSGVIHLELQRSAPTGACDSSNPTFTGAGACNPFAGRQTDDLLVTYDYVGSNNVETITTRRFDAGSTTGGNKNGRFLGVTPIPDFDAKSNGDASNATFGEAAINLTTAGILPPVGEQCVTFAKALPFTQTGNSDSANLIDVVLDGYPGPTISNCGRLVVEKVTSPTGLSGPFPVELKKGASSLASFDLAAHGSSFVYGDSADEPLFAGSDYSLTETVPTGWDPDYTVDCSRGGASAIDGDGNITVVANATTTCTITNTAIAPTITLVKTVNNQFGGTATAADFQAKLDGSNVAWNTAIETTIGSHTASESTLPGYTAGDWGGDCAANGSITLGPGDEATCSITNSDVQPTVTLEKTVDNTAGGTATADDFQASIDGTDVAWGTAVGRNVGDYTASETTLPGYLASPWGGDCAADGSVSLALGDAKTCTITNTAIAPTLTVVKEVDNNSGGTLGPDDFPLFLNGASVTSGASNSVTAGVEYTVTETQQTGYAQTDLVCVDDATDDILGHPVTLALAQSATCTITNTDVMPGLTVLKEVNNNDGGELGPDAFQLRVNGGPIAHGVALANPQAGVEYDVTEDDPTDLGYEYVSTVCVDAGTQEEVANPVTLALGQAVVCTITNDDVAPTVTVTKQVINDDGGTAEVGDFTLYLGEDEVTSGETNTVTAGVEYTVSEDLVDGYEQVSITCTDADDNDLGATFTPGLADEIDCVIVNDDIAPTVTVTKVVNNDNGGTAVPGDFTLYVGESEVTSGVSNTVTAGTEYTVSEDLVDGYEQVAFSCVDADENSLGDTFTPALGQHISCVIINTDIAPTVTVTKVVINDDGGTAVPGDFTLYVGESEVTSGVSNTVTAGTEYTVSEDLVDGYELVSIECTDGGTDLGATFTPGLAQDIDCTITNDDIAPTLTVVKEVINDDGGTLGVADFPLFLDGESVTSGASNTVTAGVAYTVTETQQTGYIQTGLVCVDDATDVELDHPVTLALAQSATCTITNDDIPPGLTVVKEVVNDDGGELGPEDFQLRVNGDPIAHNGSVQNPQAGVEYLVTEDDPTDLGYANAGTVCIDVDTEAEVDNPVVLALGQSVLCTVTNDDIAPTVTVTKQVINDDGGNAVPADFTLLLGEDEVVSGDSNAVTAGVEHTVSEELVDNYEQVSITCLDGEEDLGATFTLGLAQDVDCIIVNDDLPSGVSLVKDAVLDADDEGIRAITVDEGETATITYRFVVTNTGQTTLTDLVLEDDKIGSVTLTETTLAPGESTEAFADYTLTAADIAAGQVDNIGTVTGTDGFGNEQTEQDDETVFVIEVLAGVPGLNLIKTALVDTDGQGNKVVEVDAGETATVTYRFVITNTGDTVIGDLSLVDDKIGGIPMPVTSLEPGESITVDADYTLTAADIAAGSVENIGIVTGTDPRGTEVDATDDEVVDIVEVRVVVVEPVETPEVPVEVKPAVLERTLPRTGVEGDRLFALGVLLASIGAAALLFTPRRRRSA